MMSILMWVIMGLIIAFLVYISVLGLLGLVYPELEQEDEDEYQDGGVYQGNSMCFCDMCSYNDDDDDDKDKD